MYCTGFTHATDASGQLLAGRISLDLNLASNQTYIVYAKESRNIVPISFHPKLNNEKKNVNLN